MEAIYTALATDITPAALFGQIALGAGIIGVMVVFAFGYRTLKKTIKGASKGKVNF